MKKSLFILSFVSLAFVVIAINGFACRHGDKNNDSSPSQTVEEPEKAPVDLVIDANVEQDTPNFQPGNIIAFSDDMQTLLTWKPALADNTGREVYCCDFNGFKGRSRDAVRAFISSYNLKELQPKAVFLQVGCNADADPDINYEKVLFDYPTGEVCTLTGKMARNKRIAVSKPDSGIDATNFAGCLYLIIRQIRKTYPDARVFILPPVSAEEPTADKRCTQIASVAQMFCLPFIEKPEQLQSFHYLWTGEKPNIGKLLILGDSYSEQRRWINSLEKISNVDVVNLGVTSATVRDQSGDRKSFPYTDNPVKTDGQKNHNTLSSQLLKLRRLMAGNKLYPGEKPLTNYKPDIIIIEGGSNDNPDPTQVVQNYVEDIRQDRRTSFAGALGHLRTELHTMFPDAKIFITSTAGLYFGHTDRPFDYIIKSEQQRKAAKMLGCPTINWDLDGRLSFVFNNSAGTGDGTASRPFRYNAESSETIDLLHPNDYGALFFAESAIRWMHEAGAF